MFEIIKYIAVFSAGFASAFINIMAGGGSVLTLGLLMFLGLDAAVANGTNRIGLFVENVSGVAAYLKEKPHGVSKSIIYGLCALPGAIIGSFFALNISNEIFQRILFGVMIFVIFSLMLPTSKVKSEGKSSGIRQKAGEIAIYPVMFLIGLYGGFIQAGVGFIIMLSVKYLLKLDLVEINRHKIIIVLVYSIPILLIFGLTRNIHWGYAIALGLGNLLGAWLSVKVSVKKGDKAVKAALCGAALLMAVRFFLWTE